jgi:hypothetical protein
MAGRLLAAVTGRRRPGAAATALALTLALVAGACSGSDGDAAPSSPSDEPPTSTSTSTSSSTTTTAPPPPTLGDRALVGAYYYLWNPQNLAQGWLRNRLRPPQRDMQTQAETPDHGAAEDVAQAAAAGIDFFAVNWWPDRPEQNRRLDEAVLPALGDRMRFCIFYETQQLGFDAADGTTLLGRAQATRLAADFADLARRYFGRPDYLTVDGRPVVVLYLTRTLVGDVVGAVTAARQAAREAGFEVLLVGDEIFPTVARLGPRRGPTVTTPQPARAELFDALTGYNLYEPRRRDEAGSGATSPFLADARHLYDVYRYATGGRVPLVPGVIPGFNDRGVRSKLGHPVLPRQWAPGEPEGSFLAHALDEFAIPLLDDRLPMVLVTSWNEWNEDTAIEPIEATAPTSVDDSRTGRAFTDGFPYAGNGTAYVDVVGDRFAASAGR